MAEYVCFDNDINPRCKGTEGRTKVLDKVKEDSTWNTSFGTDLSQARNILISIIAQLLNIVLIYNRHSINTCG